jgi:hypothetical protein
MYAFPPPKVSQNVRPPAAGWGQLVKCHRKERVHKWLSSQISVYQKMMTWFKHCLPTIVSHRGVAKPPNNCGQCFIVNANIQPLQQAR